jgi:ABC-type polysaccharide/polyol phosphate export permease
MPVVKRQNLALAVQDIWDGARSTHLWLMLGWQDIKQRYRRSVIGPFWLTISNGILIVGMGPLYGRLLQQDTSSYFAYLAISYIIWTLIAGIINDSCSAFIGAEGYIKQVKLPLTVHVLRAVWRNLLIFAHNFVIVLVIFLIYVHDVNWRLWLVPLALIMIAINGVWLGLLFGLLCARYRDVPQIIASLVQVAFFLTPIVWRGEMLGGYEWAVDLNPLYHFLQIARSPLLDAGASSKSWLVAALITAVGFLVTLLVFSRYRARVAYWM